MRIVDRAYCLDLKNDRVVRDNIDTVSADHAVFVLNAHLDFGLRLDARQA